MTIDDIRPLYQYDRWANNRVLQAASRLSAEEFTRDLGGSFHSVRTLVHIIGGEWIWLRYWKGPPTSSALLTGLRTHRDRLFNPDSFPNVATVQLKWAEVENEQIEFVNRLTDELLERMLPPRNTSQIGALDATCGEPFHLSPRPNRTDDAAAFCPACAHGLPCVFGGMFERSRACAVEPHRAGRSLSSNV